MSSYFVNSTFPVSLPGGHESLLGQIPLYSSRYTDPLRHFSNATYGAANMQEKAYPTSYYQQTSGVYGRPSTSSPCDYPAGTFYKDSDRSCAFANREEQPLFVTQDQRKSECLEQNVNITTAVDDKSSLLYPWMQRMNSCTAGQWNLYFWFLLTFNVFSLLIYWKGGLQSACCLSIRWLL